MEKALEALNPPMERDKLAENLLPWLNDLRLSRNAIDTILNLPPHNAMLEKARYAHYSLSYSSGSIYTACLSRVKWQLIQAMQMLLEHVMLKHPKVPVTYARRLELVSFN